jgi:hypothetical protein
VHRGMAAAGHSQGQDGDEKARRSECTLN